MELSTENPTEEGLGSPKRETVFSLLSSREGVLVLSRTQLNHLARRLLREKKNLRESGAVVIRLKVQDLSAGLGGV